jgi:hypothetical protein
VSVQHASVVLSLLAALTLAACDDDTDISQAAPDCGIICGIITHDMSIHDLSKSD